MSLVTILVVVLIFALFYWAIHKIAAAFGLAPQIVVVLDVVLVILFVIWILGTLGLGGGPSLRLR